MNADNSPTPLQATTDFWDGTSQVREERISACWLAKPLVRQYVNEAIGSGRSLWPLHWFKSLYPNRFQRGLSIGCGSGALERALIELEICERVDAFDGAVASLHEAQRESEARGWQNRIRYFAADFNHATFPRRAYDIVFFNQSLHHVARLEHLLSEVAGALKPGGLIYLDEYVGPSRHDWSAGQLAVHQAIYSLMPREWRLHDRVPPPIEYEDPSEAVRSSEILEQLGIGFQLREKRDYGGTLLTILVPLLNWNVVPEEFLKSLIAAEREWLLGGASAYCTVVVAEPRRGLAGALARMRWALEPKWRGLRVRLGRVMGRTVPF